MNKTFLIAGAFFAMMAVVLGAFGAHGLENKLTTNQLNTFETGVRYQFYHALGLMLIAILAAPMQHSNLVGIAGWFFIIGIFFFSGSVYLLSCRELLGLENWRWLGPITPLGGTCFIIGWLLLLVAALRH